MPKQNRPQLQQEEMQEETSQLVQEAAYFKAQARGFAPGGELQDWFDAENEVRRRRERTAQNERSA